MSDLPEHVDLVRKDKYGNWYPVGRGQRTKNGKGFVCKIFPGQKISGQFFMFEARQQTQQKPEPEYISAIDEFEAANGRKNGAAPKGRAA